MILVMIILLIRLFTWCETHELSSTRCQSGQLIWFLFFMTKFIWFSFLVLLVNILVRSFKLTNTYNFYETLPVALVVSLGVKIGKSVCQYDCSYSGSGLLKIFFIRYQFDLTSFHEIWIWFNRSVWSNLLKNATFQCNRSSSHCHPHQSLPSLSLSSTHSWFSLKSSFKSSAYKSAFVFILDLKMSLLGCLMTCS